MKTHFTEDGTLVLPDWKFSGTDARVPHRNSTLAEYADVQQAKHGPVTTIFIVSTNHGHTLFWVRAVGPGFAGSRSRASHTVATRNTALAEAWIAAVKSGKVKIE